MNIIVDNKNDFFNNAKNLSGKMPKRKDIFGLYYFSINYVEKINFNNSALDVVFDKYFSYVDNKKIYFTNNNGYDFDDCIIYAYLVHEKSFIIYKKDEFYKITQDQKSELICKDLSQDLNFHSGQYLELSDLTLLKEHSFYKNIIKNGCDYFILKTDKNNKKIFYYIRVIDHIISNIYMDSNYY